MVLHSSCKQTMAASNDWKALISAVIRAQGGVIFASPALVGRGIYAGRGIIANNTDFSQDKVDARGYVNVEWWIMSRTVARNAIPLADEGLTYLILGEGRRVNLMQALLSAGPELMGEYSASWPLTKVLDIGGNPRPPVYTGTSSIPPAEVPPIPCHVHAGEVVKGACVGPGKTEAYFFPPTDVPPYNLNLQGNVITRLGIKPETSKDQFKQALTKFGINDDMYKLMNVYEVQPWETWFIEEKIIHAPGPWPTFEIQRPQDDYNLLAWQLGQEVPQHELQSTICDHHLKGLTDQDTLIQNTIDWDSNTDPQFRDKWRSSCERLEQGDWGYRIRLFYHLFYGEGFIISPGKTYTRDKDERPYAGIIWSGEGTINNMAFDMADMNKREFLVTPGSTVTLTNTSDQLDMMVFTVFPMNK